MKRLKNSFSLVLVLMLVLTFSMSSQANEKNAEKKKSDSGRSVASKKKYNKTQEVNFDEADIEGTVRRPEGMFLVQKKGIDFDPLYRVRQNFDRNIRESIDYLR
jgi:hypothetical protein